MRRFYEFEKLSTEVRKRLRDRILARRMLVILVALFVALILGSPLVPSGLERLLHAAGAVVALAVLFLDLSLLFDACPRCEEAFAEPGVIDLVAFPSPSALASNCAHCNVPLSRSE